MLYLQSKNKDELENAITGDPLTEERVDISVEDCTSDSEGKGSVKDSSAQVLNILFCQNNSFINCDIVGSRDVYFTVTMINSNVYSTLILATFTTVYCSNIF